MFKRLPLAAALVLIVFWACLVAGWVMNIIDLINWVGASSPEFVIRIVGIFIPIIGAIMGWL